MKKIVFFLLYLFVQSAFAISIYDEETSNYSALWENGYSTIQVNNFNVHLYPVDPKNCTKKACVYSGQMDNNNLFLGDNRISFKTYQMGCNNAPAEIISTYNQYAINNNNQKINFFNNLRRQGKCPAPFNQSTVISLSLDQIDYQLYLKVNRAISDQYKNLADFKSAYASTEADIASEKAKLDALEQSINDCYQTASSATSLSSVENQFSKCDNFKKAYDSLSALIKSKELVSEEARAGFNDGLQKFGNTVTDFKYQGKSVLSNEAVASIEKSILDQMPAMREQKAARLNFLARFADNINERLNALYSQGKRDEFIMLADYADQKLNEFSADLAQKNYPYTETQALSEVTKSIQATLDKYVDKNLWFNDLNIPLETKNAVDNVLSKIDHDASRELKAALQKSNKIKAEAIRKGINDALGFFNVLNGVKSQTSQKAIDSFMTRAANQFVTFIKNDGLCLGARLAMNDASDLFELVSGRDFCNIERELTISERAFAGLGLVIGSGELWSKAASKSSGAISAISSKMSDFFKKGTKWGLKTEEEIIEYSQVVRSSQSEGHMARELLLSEADEIKSLTHFGPVNQGPLHQIKACADCSTTIADSFRSSTYFKVSLEEDIILYRVQTKGEETLGRYWTRIKPGTGLSSKIDSALLSEWGNAANEVVSIKIPKGTNIEIFEGIAGEQVSKMERLLGGGNQVFINTSGKFLEQFKL